MNLLGIHLTLYVGENEPQKAPMALTQALQSVEVTHSDQGPSGFQLTFHVGRATALDLMDYRLLANQQLKPFTRVILVVRFAFAPQVLMDGIITNQQLNPSNEPGASTLTVTGEDISVMMDLIQEPQEFPGLSDYDIVKKIVEQYKDFGLQLQKAPAIPQEACNQPNPDKQKTNKPGPMTDRAYLQKLAQDYGCLFYVKPGPERGQSQVYWGPPEKQSTPQRALSANMGPATNVEAINFRFDALRPERVSFTVGQSPQKPEPEPELVTSPIIARNIELARNLAVAARRQRFSTYDDPQRAKATAQGDVNRSFDEVVTASGQLDALRYDGLLEPRRLVSVRGVGETYAGLYYVKSVTHNITKGRYMQSFSLAREGTGKTTGFILP